jgi:type IV secretory pathway VirB2 component (pilin)
VAIMACIVFLGINWLAGRSSWLLFLLLFIPCYACGEWLSTKIFSENSGLSLSRSSFSVLRIIYGVILASLLFGAIYIVELLLSHWLL